ncbi:MAG TPA: VOC family protein [Parafilimonas sp.]|nr:VOC family protein [Parafilimonas sp.]
MNTIIHFAIKKMSPQLLVANVERSIEFYTTQLGFDVDFRFEDFYAGIIKDGYSIHIKMCKPSKIEEAKPNRNKEDVDILFAVDDIESLYEELTNKSVNITQPLRQMPYGKEFYVADPDGNMLAFLE